MTKHKLLITIDDDNEYKVVTWKYGKVKNNFRVLAGIDLQRLIEGQIKHAKLKLSQSIIDDAFLDCVFDL